MPAHPDGLARELASMRGGRIPPLSFKSAQRGVLFTNHAHPPAWLPALGHDDIATGGNPIKHGRGVLIELALRDRLHGIDCTTYV